MNPWVTVVPIVVTILLAVIGWLITVVHTKSQVIATQAETIRAQERQIDRLEITAELTDRVVSQLPKPRTGGGR